MTIFFFTSSRVVLVPVSEAMAHSTLMAHGSSMAAHGGPIFILALSIYIYLP